MLNFVITLPLKIEKFQEDILNKKFEECRKVYNSCLGEILKRYNHMKESKEYKRVCKLKKGKDRNEEFNKINNKYNLTEYSLHHYVKHMAKFYNIDAMTGQKLATRAFKSIEKLMFHTANKVNFIKHNEIYSIEGKSNKQGIRFKDNVLMFNKMTIPVIIKERDDYAKISLQGKIKYCRIVKKEIKGKNKWYVQLILKGTPPIKSTKQNKIGEERVGIDIGTRTVAYSSNTEVKLLELAPNVNNIDKQIKLLQRKMDRSRRSMNPNKYNEDGTIKKGIRVNGKLTKLKWIKSNKYIKTQNELREVQRKQADIRKQSHEKLANDILSLGCEIYVETMNFKGLQKRSKETTVNKKGKFNKKKRFGKSIANKAPSMLLSIIDRKLKYINLKLVKINTYKVKASQYNHFTDDYNKKELKDRWNNSIEIQRDMYSAFLIMNVNSDLVTINRDKCIETYDNFKVLHDIEIKRLKELKASGVKLISSMGI